MWKNLSILPKDVPLYLGTSIILIVIFYVYFLLTVGEFRNTLFHDVEYRKINSCLEDIAGHIRREESAQRGFVMTQRSSYLKPYYESRENLDLLLNELDLLSEHYEKKHKTKLATDGMLRQLINEKEAEMEKTIRFVKSKQQAKAVAIILTDEGQKMTLLAESLIKKDMKALAIQLAERRHKIENKLNRIVEAMVLGGALVFVLLACVLYCLWKEILSRHAYEGKLASMNEELEKTVLVRTDELNSEKEALKLNDAKLMEKNRFIQSITDAMQDGIYCIDNKRNINFINPAGARVLGYTPEELLGKRAHETLHYKHKDGSVFPLHECPFVNVIYHGVGVKDYEDILIAKDGTIIPILCSASPVTENGEILGAVISFKDLSSRKAIQKALQDKEDQFQVLANSISQFAWMANPDTSITWFNQRWYDYSGTTFEEMAGQGWHKILHPDEVKCVVDHMNYCFENGILWEDTFPLRSKTGEYRWFLSRALPVKDEEGMVKFWFGTNTDITEMREMQSALAESEEKFRTVTEAMPQIVWVTSPEGKVEYFNQRWTEYTGIPTDDAYGDAWGAAFHPEDLPRTIETWTRSLQSGEPYNIEYRIKNREGEYRWFLGRALPMRDRVTNEIVRWFGSCTEIEDLVEARNVIAQNQEVLESKVQARTEELQAVNKELEAFSYSISHDLRSPLRSIAGFSQALLRHKQDLLDEEGQNYLTRILANATRMGQLIDDILQLSRLTRGKMTFKTVNLSQLADDIVTNLREAEPERQVAVEIDPNLETSYADETLLRVVLQNLIENAWKFTSNTKNPKIEVGRLPQKKGNSKATYFVRDNGVGFDMKYADKLFGLFQRLHGMDEYPGTGIGLATVQRIISRHEGQVWAESNPSKATTFYFTLQP